MTTSDPSGEPTTETVQALERWMEMDWFAQSAYPLVSSNMAGWKTPKLNGVFFRKMIDKWSIFQPAMCDSQRLHYLVG